MVTTDKQTAANGISKVIFVFTNVPTCALMGVTIAYFVMGRVQPSYGGSSLYDLYRWFGGGIYGFLFGIIFSGLAIWKWPLLRLQMISIINILISLICVSALWVSN